MAHLHLDLLHKKDEETRLRAITYKGGGLSTIKGNFTDLPKFSEFNLSGRGIYLVVNSGGDKAADLANEAVPAAAAGAQSLR